MFLMELLEIIDADGSETIQVCRKGFWDEYDTFRGDSTVLKTLGDLEIGSLAAIKENVFRVSLDLSAIDEE